MNVILKNVEVRGYEIKKSSSTGNEYGVVFFEEESGRAGNVLCRDLSLVRDLKKGESYDFYCQLVIAKYIKFELSHVDYVLTDSL